MRTGRFPITAAGEAALAICLLAATACRPTGPTPTPTSTATPTPTPGDRGSLALVETWPVETSLDHADVPDAHEVWIEMIDGARESLAFEHFYASGAPEGHPDRLEDVIAAVERAAARGVRVRFVFGAAFYRRTYRAIPDRLSEVPGVEVRILDLGAAGGSVQHAKFFVVDDREVYLGSQNFDWRALTHIQELGVRIAQPEVARALGAVFALDWAIAGGDEPPPSVALVDAFPVRVPYKQGAARIAVGLSPSGILPDDALWDLPRLVAMIEGARTRVRVQVMTYAVTSRDGSEFRTLDDALRAAAARGVQVELMFADWAKRPKLIGAIQALQEVPGVTVKLVTIPQHSAGFIPFARVVHSKLMTVDGERAWVGTSNWSGDYFYRSRNVGVFVEGAEIAADIDRLFATTWGSPYAAIVDPAASYEPPRIGE